ncbi:MAG: dockerin type I domain-containing protein, partial [Planctomycetota bacterium]|nr:dockerin type I domain-containing protein [Planctomycetota bacterium]
YDVNKDGQVNVSDLLQVLAAQGENGQASLDNMPLLTVDGLKAAWGETDSIYDLDSDGTVNVNDLLKLLAEGGTIHHPDAPITVEGVKLAMESGNLAYDVNKDGQVNVSDLLQVLADQGKASNAGASARETSPSDPKARFIDHNMASRPLPKEELEERTRIALGRPAFEPVSSSFAESVARERQEMQRLSESLYDRFLKNGFALKPPANLHAILDQFELPRPDRQHLLEQLTDRYPQGLGVNRVG